MNPKQKIELKVGSSSITIDQTSIKIKALTVEVEATAELKTKAGAMATHDGGADDGDQGRSGDDQLMGSATDTTPPATIAPAPGLRVQLGRQLFGTMPEMADDIVARPGEGEHVFDFCRRLRLGETPEEAISLMAFALQPRPAVWWGHECLKAAPELLTEQDRAMMDFVRLGWASRAKPIATARWMRALHVAVRGPGAWLGAGGGLGVGLDGARRFAACTGANVCDWAGVERRGADGAGAGAARHAAADAGSLRRDGRGAGKNRLSALSYVLPLGNSPE